jgi:hypothetical protein
MRQKRIRDVQPQAVRGYEGMFQAYGFTKNVVESLIGEGLPCYMVGRSYYFNIQTVNNWLEENKTLKLPEFGSCKSVVVSRKL